MAELHVIGQIVGAAGFGGHTLLCKVGSAASMAMQPKISCRGGLTHPCAPPCALATQWGIHAGRSWELIEGMDEGQTQADQAADGDMAVWGHPVDAHYVCRGLSGWPKLHFQIWSQDKHGRNELCEWGDSVT